MGLACPDKRGRRSAPALQLLSEVRECAADRVCRCVVDRCKDCSGGELLICELLEAKLRAVLNCHSIGNHLICFGRFRFDPVAIGAIGFDRERVLDREGIRLSGARPWGQESSRSATCTDSYRARDNSLAPEVASVYLHGSGASPGATRVGDLKGPIIYNCCAGVSVRAAQRESAGADLGKGAARVPLQSAGKSRAQ